MSNKHNYHGPQFPSKTNNQETVTTLLDYMIDGREFESILKYNVSSMDIISELRRGLKEIETLRGRPAVCYIANIVNSNVSASVSIDDNDDLPFSEMIGSVPKSERSLDVLLVSPGGIAQQVAKFVNKLRPRFDNVTFILPYMAMSAATILSMSGDDIIMGPNSYIGPVDPQVLNKEGKFVPAQSIFALVDDIKERGQAFLQAKKPIPWTDFQLLNNIDSKEIGNALSLSQFSIELVETYLYRFKFQNWLKHTSSQRDVTDEDRKTRAKEVAEALCDHKRWKSHARGITRETAWEECKILITHSESIDGLERLLRREWALLNWIFEKTPIAKILFSNDYSIIRGLPKN